MCLRIIVMVRIGNDVIAQEHFCGNPGPFLACSCPIFVGRRPLPSSVIPKRGAVRNETVGCFSSLTGKAEEIARLTLDTLQSAWRTGDRHVRQLLRLGLRRAGEHLKEGAEMLRGSEKALWVK